MRLNAHKKLIQATSVLCTFLLMPGDISPLIAQQQTSAPQNAKTLPPDQLDSLVAPIALYPDPLLAQVLAASTYPLEIIQLQQWLAKNSNLKDQALAEAVKKEPWDPSVQGIAALPDLVKQMGDNIKWTTELGDAVLAQQSDVMDAVQRMRKTAEGKGQLKSNDYIKVDNKSVDSKNIVVIEQANPEVIYVPSYNPTVVWGAAPYYPYPPMYYPPAGYYAAGMALSFGVGVAMGAFWGGGGWGYNCGWGGNNNININNNFNRNTNIGNGNRGNLGGGNRVNGGGGRWSHNPSHRGGAPYGDRATADRFGGNARGDSLSKRQQTARQNIGQRQQNLGQRGGGQGGLGNRGGAGGGGVGAANRSGNLGGGNRGGAGGNIGGANRSGGNFGGANRAGGGDSIGNRQIGGGGGSRNGGAFAGANRGGGAARSSGSRGSSSFGGGGSRGGGARGGGARGGGGRRR